MSIKDDLVGAGRILATGAMNLGAKGFKSIPQPIWSWAGWCGLAGAVATGTIHYTLWYLDKKFDNKAAPTKPVQDKVLESVKKVQSVNSKAAEAAKGNTGTVYIKVDKPVKKAVEETAKSKAGDVLVIVDNTKNKAAETSKKTGDVLVIVDNTKNKGTEQPVKGKAAAETVQKAKKPTHDPVDSEVSAKFAQKDGAVGIKVGGTQALIPNNVAAFALDHSHNESDYTVILTGDQGVAIVVI